MSRFGGKQGARLFWALFLFAVNAALCAPLFRIEYLDDFQSNEGSFITFGRFLRDYAPHVSWFPWFNAGMPFEDTYFPLTACFVALFSRIGGCSPAHALHLLAALAYSLGPVFMFLFASWFSGRIAPALTAALFWSLLSPSVVFAPLREDLGAFIGLRRLQNIVVYGETPHNLALALLPLALWLVGRFLAKPTLRGMSAAALLCAAAMAANAFGMVIIPVCCVMLAAARGGRTKREWAGLAGVLLLSYLAICRAVPPQLLRLIAANSQLVGGDYRYGRLSTVYLIGFAVLLVGLWAILRRRAPPVQFAALFLACFGGVTFLGLRGISLLPQPERYHIEMEMGACLLAGFAVEWFARRLPGRLAAILAVASIAVLAWIGVADYRFSRKLIRPANITASLPYKEATWIAANLPGQRVLSAAEGQWLFNVFADNPQLGAGHEPSAPNWIERVAVYTIYVGANAGDQDAAISILWLKAFGCGAVVVPGPASKDHYHAVVNPQKFDGLLPRVWQEAGDSIYKVPLRSASLAHVIPGSAVVARRPVHGLDVAPVQPYVAALEDPAAPLASLDWRTPSHGRIRARLSPGRVISVQITYDSGWRARVGARPVPLRADQLGLMVIDPDCSGECTIDLEFDGGPVRRILLAVSIAVLAALLLALVLPGR